MVNDSAAVVFDDERAVANTGVVLPAMLAGGWGSRRWSMNGSRSAIAPAPPTPGRKVASLLAAMALGADCIEDCELLRCGQTGALLPHRVAAPSTLGTFLRSFTFGHVRQLDRVLGEAIARAWAAGAGPGEDRLTIDVDSFVGRGARLCQAGCPGRL